MTASQRTYPHPFPPAMSPKTNGAILVRKGIGIIAFAWNENEVGTNIRFVSDGGSGETLTICGVGSLVGGTTSLESGISREYGKPFARVLWESLVDNGWERLKN